MNDAPVIDHGTDEQRRNDDGSEELVAFIERIESLEEEKRDTAGRIKEEYKYAKSRGFDVGIMRKVIAARKVGAETLIEEMRLLATYLRAAGLENTPLGEWATSNTHGLERGEPL